MEQITIQMGNGKGRIVGKCKLNDCFRKHEGNGLCGKHYMRMKRQGNTDKRKKHVWNEGTRGICKVENCERPHSRQGYCNMHALRIDKYGTIELPKREIKICNAENCERVQHANGFCNMHDRQNKRNGKPELQPKFTNLCHVCFKEATGHGFCQTHLRRYQVWGDPLKVGSTKGYKASEETCQKQREYRTGKDQKYYESIGKNHPRTGKKHTEKTKEQIRLKKYMSPSGVRNSNTTPERLLKSVLTTNGVLYESQKSIYGRPDIFIEPNICIFADGNHFHADPKKYKEFDNIAMTGKISKQIWERDNRVNKTLIEQKYIVIRFWENEIKKSPMDCLNKIKEVMS